VRKQRHGRIEGPASGDRAGARPRNSSIGEFGPVTRQAIRAFQLSKGEPETGILTAAQRTALLEPEVEARRKAEAELEAKRQAEAEAARRKAEAELEAKRQAEAETARKLEEAEAFARKINEARSKGTEYAGQVSVRWSVSERRNEMTDDYDYTVRSSQPNERGALAEVEGTCDRSGTTVFLATLSDARDPGAPLGFPGAGESGIAGEKRINDDPPFAWRFPISQFRNSIVVSTLASMSASESMETTWRVLAEIQTTSGLVLIRIATFDPGVQKLLSACKKRAEFARRRAGQS
jgi:hypothetical protein